MESVAAGYTGPDPPGSGDGPWATPAPAPTPAPPEDAHADGGPLSPTEEALVRALAEVDRVEAELKALEPLRERLQTELQRAATDADALVTQVSDAYAREQHRLEAELRLVQRRAASLERIREERLPRRGADESNLVPDLDPDPLPAGSAVLSGPELAHRPASEDPPPPDAPATPGRRPKKLGVVKAIGPNGRGNAHPVTGAPEHSSELPIAPEAGVATDAPPIEGQRPQGTPRTPVAEATPEPSPPPMTAEPRTRRPDEEASAYEDHWYQVLRRDSLGGTS